jgi:hypothetical protein
VGNLRDKRIIRVGVGQQGADGEQDLRNCQSRAPLLFKNVKAYTSIAVDIWMEDFSLERHLQIGIAHEEVQPSKENAKKKIVHRHVDRYVKHTIIHDIPNIMFLLKSLA